MKAALVDKKNEDAIWNDELLVKQDFTAMLSAQGGFEYTKEFRCYTIEIIYTLIRIILKRRSFTLNQA